LSIEEKEKLTAAIHGYLLGKKEGSGGGAESAGLSTKNRVDFFTDPSTTKTLGKLDVGPGGQGPYGKRINVWDKVNKVWKPKIFQSEKILKFQMFACVQFSCRNIN
jgi:hypothetical protein